MSSEQSTPSKRPRRIRRRKKRKHRSVPPLRDLRKLTAKLNINDRDLEDKLNKEQLWAHSRENEVVLKKTQKISPKTKEASPVEKVEFESRHGGLISTLSQEDLSKPRRVRVSARELEEFAEYQKRHNSYTRDHLSWDSVDTGYSRDEAHRMFLQ